MGCGSSSQEVSNVNQTQSSSVQSSSEAAVHHNKSKIDDANLNGKIESPSPIELLQEDHDHGRLDKEPATNVQKHTPVSKKKRLSTDSGLSDAWTSVHGKSNDQNVEILDDDLSTDSEFGREGIDIFSSSMDGMRSKSGKSKPSTKGIQSDVLPRLTKKHSEELFDPSPLIDVDKFKAVNAPKEAASNNTNSAVIVENGTNVAHPVSNGQTTILSPSNYHDFYDEDEKALMESIEQDFKETTYTSLPGVVM